MRNAKITRLLAVAVTLSFFSVSTSAFAAAITFQAGNNPLTGTANVAFNEAGLLDNSTTVQGILPSDTLVSFTSATTLTSPSAGQARVEGQSSAFADLTISLVGTTFTGIIFNVNIANANGGPPDTGSLGITANYTSPAGAASQTFSVSSAGENFFTIFSDTGIDITSVMLSMTGVGALDVRQVRIAESGEETPVPAPASLLLLGAGLLGLGAVGRRRRRA